MALPHTFATQTGNVPASQWDDNFSYLETLLSYVPQTSGLPTTIPTVISGLIPIMIDVQNPAYPLLCSYIGGQWVYLGSVS